MENITQEQRELLERLTARDAAVEVHWDETRGVASSIRGEVGMDAPVDAEEKLEAFLKEFGGLLGPSDLPEGLDLLRRREDELDWEHLVYQYRVAGKIEVYGAKLAAHFDANGSLVEVQSSLWRDIKVDTEPEITPDALRHILRERIEDVEGFDAVREAVSDVEKEDFPMTDDPRLVAYPWQGEFHLAWLTYGYGDFDERQGRPVDTPCVAYGQICVDAKTGKRLLFAPTLQTAEVPDTGSGLAVTPLTSTHTSRPLAIVREGTSSTYRLKDTTHNRDIVTYDASCDTGYNSNAEIGGALKGGTLPLSEDTDGDKNWDRLPTNTTSAQRISGQQPEVDAHYFARQQYKWYDALAGGRDGWDDGNYTNPPVPPQTINVVAHCYPPPTWGVDCSTVNAYKWARKSGGTWVYWLAFMNGDGTTYDYPAGSHFIFAHEYQHAITDFSFEDGAGDPGLTYAGWLGAVHEGLSDVFGVLSSEQWLPARDISHATPAQVFRNIVYPRDTAAYDSNMLDHFDDRNVLTGFYERGTILAHCAYLMGKGGVHQRASRTPEFIPVYGLGRQTVGGKSVLKAARIWYRALTHYFSTHGNLTGLPANDESSFRTLRNGCVSAAIDLYGNGSAEHRNTVLAFYAVGLPAAEGNYGADVTFLRWGVSWDLSRNYVGLTSPNYSSLDLFINNGGASEWNALINVNDPGTGQPTEYENTVYCRVRNVGDLEAKNVEVEFHYAKAGTATWNWLPVEDKNGNAQKMVIGTLGAGQSNFPDSDQNSPPASASVKWCIPPLAPGETVDHFCLRARLTCSNDVNAHNNEVQSNVAYTAYAPAAPARMSFVAGNPPREEEEDMTLQLKVETTLPESWRTYLKGYREGEKLRPGDERVLDLIIDMPPGAERALEPPLDGDLRGVMYGKVRGDFVGTLSDTVLGRRSLGGRFAGLVRGVGTISGPFKGRVNLRTGEVEGRVVASHPKDVWERLYVDLKGCLRPWRRVDVSQWDGEELVGGFTAQVQIPWESGPCAYRLPPTDTKVAVRRKEGPVVVARKDRLYRYTLTGELMAKWRVKGGVRSYAVGPEGEIYVALMEAPTVRVYDPDGDPLGEWSVEQKPSQIMMGRGGEVIALADEGRLVFVYSSRGKLLESWKTRLR